MFMHWKEPPELPFRTQVLWGHVSPKLWRTPAALSVHIPRKTENVKSREHTIPLWVHLLACTRCSNVCMHVCGTFSLVGYTDSFEHTQGGSDRDLVAQQQKQQIINVGEVNAWWFRFTTGGESSSGWWAGEARPCEKHFPWCPWAHVIKKLKYNETQKVWTITGKKCNLSRAASSSVFTSNKP